MANCRQSNNLTSTWGPNRRWQRYAIYTLITLAGLSATSTGLSNNAPLKLSYQLLQSRPLDSLLFTQGLEIHRGQLLQSSGLYGKSKLISRALNTTATTNTPWQHILPKRYFAEGLTVFNNTVYLLSWRENTLWRFAADTGKPLGRNTYQGEGWGLTHNSQHIIRSDGSATLFFHDPETFEVSHHLSVTRSGIAVKNINELEFAHGFIWANIWHSNEILVINPASGNVQAVVDITEFAQRERAHNPDPNAVANGIAFDAQDNSFWVTGKHWQQLYQLRINIEPLTKP
ncbi:glutaminyl-peptide cyclotransferase [Gilvimarinus polysaccharolyticus]|uniref:glutaminyl-peptide cyclotransferase n=1 Tax=Gilvimarinus polysaccharolyticus TaxID=863921 RepID=UPI0006733F73|nr:glutaminyl-peptide cyclotransferase [Gilvimarinus polysaccharolyticus]